MATSQILQFAGAVDALVMSQSAYNALAARTAGFQIGIADPAQLNKVWRQSSFVAAAFAAAIAQAGYDVLDDGDLAGLTAKIIAFNNTGGLVPYITLVEDPYQGVSVVVRGGESDLIGGPVVVEGGESLYDVGGEAFIGGGAGATDGGAVSLVGGEGAAGNGGDVAILGGQALGAGGTGGSIQIQPGTNDGNTNGGNVQILNHSGTEWLGLIGDETLSGSLVDDDGTLAAADDNHFPTALAVKTYVNSIGLAPYIVIVEDPYQGDKVQIHAGNSDLIGGPVEITAGDSLYDVGGEASLVGGQSDVAEGGNAVIEGGPGATTGGDVQINGGGGTTANGGAVTIEAGGGEVDGGGVDISSGDGNTASGGGVNISAGSGPTQGGLVNISAGPSVGAGGVVTITGGSGENDAAGSVEITGGESLGAGDSGAVVITGGAGEFGANVVIEGGAGAVDVGGDVQIGGGDTLDAAADAGSVSIVGGDSNGGTGGAIQMSGGSANAAGGSGGLIDIVGGPGNADGGSVSISGGESATASGADVTITGGLGAAGTGGDVSLHGGDCTDNGGAGGSIDLQPGSNGDGSLGGSFTIADHNGSPWLQLTGSGVLDGSLVAEDFSSPSDNQFPTVQAVVDELADVPGNYVEGTFTPTVTLVGGSGNTVPVYSTNTGRYTRVGNRVFVDIYLTGDGGAEGAGTGQINIALPIAASASNPTSNTPMGIAINNTSVFHIFGQIAGGASVVTLSRYDAFAEVLAQFAGSSQSNATRTIRLKFFYEV